MDKIINLPELLGLHIGNPLGLSPVAMLIIILVLVTIMSGFNHFIRYREKSQFYPMLYAFFAASLLAVYYYIFQENLPGVDGHGYIGWHCRTAITGSLFLSIIGIVLTSLVSFGIFIATMQIVAQLSVEAGMSLQEKRWKEWKWGLAVVLFGVSIAGIGFEINKTFGGWALVLSSIATVVFVIVKIIRDTINCGNFLWALLIGIVFLLGSAASMALFLDVVHACVYLVIFIAAFLSGAKARKKKLKIR